MHPSGSATYRSTAVETASPSQRRLMLLEGAVTAGRSMQAAFDASDHEGIAHHGSRCRSILIALMTELNPSVDLRLARDLGSLYTFLWQQMAEARSAEELDDTIEILEQQRDAWRMAVELLQSGPPSPGDGPLDVAG